MLPCLIAFITLLLPTQCLNRELLRDRSSTATLDERLYAFQDANWNVTAILDATGVIQELMNTIQEVNDVNIGVGNQQKQLMREIYQILSIGLPDS